jgi:pyrroline-5-carboxylate reductase
MNTNSIGFIGGGRVVAILLGGWQRAGILPGEVIVADSDPAVLQRLKGTHSSIRCASADNAQAAQQHVVFIALHPPAIAEALPTIRAALKPAAIVVSLAPKFTISRLSELLGGFRRIMRVIPNAPSIVNAGFNPVAFDASLGTVEREDVLSLLRPLGNCPEVEESKLEAYAILSGMGPTYLWPQFFELQALGVRFGLSELEAREAVHDMAVGTVEAMNRSGLNAEHVQDLIPVKPLAEAMPPLLEAYRTKLPALMEKIRPA